AHPGHVLTAGSGWFGRFRSAGEDGSGHEVGAERREYAQVEEAGGGHHGAVVALLQGGPGDEHQHDGGDGADAPEPAEHAAVAVVDGAAPHRHHPGGHEEEPDLEGPREPGVADQLEKGAPGQAGLDEVPVPEEHGVADRTQEEGAGDEPTDGEGLVASWSSVD